MAAVKKLLALLLTSGLIIDGHASPSVGSFSVHTSLGVVLQRPDKSGYLESFARLDESYSSELERARIGFELERPQARRGLFLLNQRQADAALLFEPTKATCRSSSVQDLRQLLNLAELAWWNLAEAPRHVVGPARLLYLLHQHRNQMRLVETNRPVLVRNITCALYSLELDKLSILAHYRLDSLGSPDEQPLRVEVSSTRASTQLEFTQWRRLSSSMTAGQLQLDASQDIQLDAFTFPPLESCISALAANGLAGKVFVGPGRGELDTWLSFDAKLKTQATKQQAHQQAEFQMAAQVSYAQNLKLLSFRTATGFGFRRQVLDLKSWRLYQLIEPANNSGEASCVVSRTRGRLPEAADFGRLIVGADELVYLGLARVRGEPAKLYATNQGSLPLWLEQPTEYLAAKDNELRWRLPDRANARTLLYLSPAGQPLYLEMYQQFTRHQVHFFNFLWDLDQSKPPASHFGLADLCPDLEAGSKKFVQLELTLEGDSQWRPSEHSSNQRALALLSGLQTSWTMDPLSVADLETRVVEQPRDRKQLLLASFRLGALTDRVADLVYLGQGYANYDKGDTVRLSARTFQVCLNLAAKEGRNRYFGYDALQRKCFIDKGNKADKSTPATITLRDREPMEMYRINSTRDEQVARFWQDETGRAKFRRHLAGFKPSLLDGAKLTFRRLEIKSGEDTEEQIAPVAGLKGLGLAANNLEVRLVEPEPVGRWSPLSWYLEEEQSEMSLSQCQAACLADPECGTFSLCLRHFRLQCLLSPFTFRGEATVAQLASLPAAARRFAVKPDQGEQLVELVRHPNCELHHKSYLELFGKPVQGSARQPVGRHRFTPVRGREQCAERCFRANVEVLRRDLELASEASALFGPQAAEEAADDGPRQDTLGELEAIAEAQRANAGRLCRAFHYAERARLGATGEAALAAELGPSQDAEADGFCSLGETGDQKQGDEEPQLELELERRPFRAELLYERRPAVRLRAAKLSEEERRQLKLVGELRGRANGQEEAEEELTPELDAALASLRTSVALGDNFQELLYAAESFCALACLGQSRGPWPACRSFNLVKGDGDLLALCQLNSITMHQALRTNRSDLVERVGGPGAAQAWHFEPRLGLQLHLPAGHAHLPASHHFRGETANRWLAAWVMAAAALLSGLWLGARLADRLVRAETSARQVELNRTLGLVKTG